MTDRDRQEPPMSDGEHDIPSIPHGEDAVAGTLELYVIAQGNVTGRLGHIARLNGEMAALGEELTLQSEALGESERDLLAADREVTTAISRALYGGEIGLLRALELLGERVTETQRDNLIELMAGLTPGMKLAAYIDRTDGYATGTLESAVPYFETFDVKGRAELKAGLLLDILKHPAVENGPTTEIVRVGLRSEWSDTYGLFTASSIALGERVSGAIIPRSGAGGSFDLRYFSDAEEMIQIADWLGAELRDWQRERPEKTADELLTVDHREDGYIHIKHSVGGRYRTLEERYDQDVSYIAQTYPDVTQHLIARAAEVIAMLRTDPEHSKFVSVHDEAAILDFVSGLLYGSEGPMHRYKVAGMLFQFGRDLIAAKTAVEPTAE